MYKSFLGKMVDIQSQGKGIGKKCDVVQWTLLLQ